MIKAKLINFKSTNSYQFKRIKKSIKINCCEGGDDGTTYGQEYPAGWGQYNGGNNK